VTTKNKERKEGNGTTVIAAIREYLSDILGAFIPGVYFSIHLVTTAILLLTTISDSKWEDIKNFISAIAPVLSHVAPFAAFVFCLFSYIIGSVFYRKDTKEPDTASAVQTYRNTNEKEKDGLAFDFENSRKDPFKVLLGSFVRIDFRVDFPYPRLRRYLRTRNYTHLVNHIPWEGNEDDTAHRSKTFVNILKARIHRYAPEEMPVIEKNEAHVRLMNSLWYAAKSIIFISVPVLLGLIVVYFVASHVAGNTFCKSLKNFISTGSTFGLAFFSTLQLGIAGYIRRSIKQYFHYMRVREIMFILEIAYTISLDTGKDLFEGLEQAEQDADPELLSNVKGNRH
jgi:hypothetical protein